MIVNIKYLRGYGKKYYDKRDTYAELRRLSDSICEEYGLEYFWCTERQMARAFGISDEKMLEIIRETNNEFDVKENRLDDFFKVPVEVGEKYFARRIK